MRKYIYGVLFAVVINAFTLNAAFADDEQALANDMATFFRAARAVISDHQKHINDPEVGDKGLSAEVVLAKAKEGFKAKTGKDLDENNPFIKAEIEAVSEVMVEAQALINERGRGFKGFLPAVFAGQTAAKVTAKLEGKGKVRLTAPPDFVRNRKNRPDEWETAQISKFSDAAWEKNKPISEDVLVDGRSAYRLIIPEYYVESCLSCHGEPKGELDITGGKKEGAKLGDLGGAVSIVIFKQ